MRTFDVDFANRFALDNKSLETIAEEALSGEQKFADCSIEKIKALLSQKSIASSSDVPKLRAPTSLSRNRRVGERKPVRDKTGGFHAAP